MNWPKTCRVPDVVCNTYPLQYLHQLGLLDLLPSLYAQVFVPRGVIAELATGLADGINLPDPARLAWLVVRDVAELPVLRAITDLGRGEREALALATHLPQPLLIFDDALARQYARLLAIPHTGTLGVLIKAKKTG